MRRELNRAVTTLKGGGQVVVHTGWGYGKLISYPASEEELDAMGVDKERLYLLFPAPHDSAKDVASWHARKELIPESVMAAMDFFWPGPIAFGVRWGRVGRRLRLSCPWHPLAQEILARHGSCLWISLNEDEQQLVLSKKADLSLNDARILLWPVPEAVLPLTYIDISTLPWRLLEQGFVRLSELARMFKEPIILSQDRAFPKRGFPSLQPEHRIVVLEAASSDELPRLVESFREQVGPEWSLRIYLEESVAHASFPDDRIVRVYGDLSDPERVRRRLEAMLERQRRRSGMRILLIAIAGLDSRADSLRGDLLKLADRWIKLGPGEELISDEFR